MSGGVSIITNGKSANSSPLPRSKPFSLNSTTTTKEQQNEASYSQDGKFIIVPGSLRPDGTVRKPRKIRVGYVPPEEKSPNTESLVDIDPSLSPSFEISIPRESQEDEEDIIDILSDDTEEPNSLSEPVSPQIPTSPSITASESPKRVRPNPEFLTRVINSTNTYNTKILPNLLDERDGDIPNYEEPLSEENVTAIGSILNQSSKSILREVERCRKREGSLLLKEIAKIYGLKVFILNDEESNSNPKEEFVNSLKRRSHRSNLSNPKQKIRKTRGKIGLQE